MTEELEQLLKNLTLRRMLGIYLRPTEASNCVDRTDSALLSQISAEDALTHSICL